MRMRAFRKGVWLRQVWNEAHARASRLTHFAVEKYNCAPHAQIKSGEWAVIDLGHVLVEINPVPVRHIVDICVLRNLGRLKLSQNSSCL